MPIPPPRSSQIRGGVPERQEARAGRVRVAGRQDIQGSIYPDCRASGSTANSTASASTVRPTSRLGRESGVMARGSSGWIEEIIFY